MNATFLFYKGNDVKKSVKVTHLSCICIYLFLLIDVCVCYREDLVCRLPDMEQPGSDQENLDSEASASSESLLDDRTPISDMEGQY